MAIVPSDFVYSDWIQAANGGPAVAGRDLPDEIDDLNRVTLAATCDVLPICRDHGVTLLVRLASQAIQILADSKRLERAITVLLEVMCSNAALSDEGGTYVRIETARAGRQAQVCVTANNINEAGLPAEPVPTARRTIEAHGGSFMVTRDANGSASFCALLPICVSGLGNLEGQIEAPLGNRAARLLQPPAWADWDRDGKEPADRAAENAALELTNVRRTSSGDESYGWKPSFQTGNAGRAAHKVDSRRAKE